VVQLSGLAREEKEALVRGPHKHHRAVLVQNVKKKFWNLWRKFKKRGWEAKPNKGRKHNTNTILKKNQKVYDFLPENAFCTFQQCEKMLQECKDREIFNSTFNSFGEKLDDVLAEKIFKPSFPKCYRNVSIKVLQECFNQSVRMIDELNLDEIMQQIERNELGEIWPPLDMALKKSTTIYYSSQKVKNYQAVIISILNQIKDKILFLSKMIKSISF
jgi:hypothetical protein